jgi:hypothetical protein
MIENFFSSLLRENGPNFSGIRIVVIDREWYQRPSFDFVALAHPIVAGGGEFIHTPPKSCVWQGRDRLTSQDWWAACNARNTAICLAPDGWIVFVDDLSVFLPGYLACVREAMKLPDTITCGAYRKVKKLEVAEDGVITSFEDHPGGHDNRYPLGKDGESVPATGGWLYGCSLVAPVEAFLSIGGFPEALCDGLSFEDVIAGIMLENRGWKIRYDRSMMTYESEEGHSDGLVMKRSDYGISPNDKSHAVLKMARDGLSFHPNYFGDEGIRGLRQRVLAGEPFPVMKIPEHEWYTGTPLKDL